MIPQGLRMRLVGAVGLRSLKSLDVLLYASHELLPESFGRESEGIFSTCLHTDFVAMRFKFVNSLNDGFLGLFFEKNACWRV